MGAAMSAVSSSWIPDDAPLVRNTSPARQMCPSRPSMNSATCCRTASSPCRGAAKGGRQALATKVALTDFTSESTTASGPCECQCTPMPVHGSAFKAVSRPTPTCRNGSRRRRRTNVYVRNQEAMAVAEASKPTRVRIRPTLVDDIGMATLLSAQIAEWYRGCAFGQPLLMT